ncbi:MAG TPA: alanine--tRNA ligase [bacterium]|nr:alanine--tRNA ligase [bacterium]
MESKKIRDAYVDFFRDRGHAVVHGSGLVPFDDATLLFTSAGMVQFKKFWATDAPIPYSTAVTCQKCMRAGGKDSDFDKIGISNRHHTFFEMLGNFSFGDYFKKEAIEWSYEFVSEFLSLPVEKVWVSYYGEDKETRDIWKKFLPEERIVPLGKKDNFWGPAGETGPCGPCTELYLDFGRERACSAGCLPGCECDRFLEFWNLVFPQYDMQSDGSMAPLKRRGVDTGMGLERMARILQKTDSNYETDLFLPIIKSIEGIADSQYGKSGSSKVFFRRIADHVRALTFLIDDNILPSNEGRGYVLRRIARRASVSGSHLGINEPFLYKLSEVPIEIMGGSYPTLKKNREMISKVLYEEEEKFRFILDSASKNFQDFLGEVRKNTMPGSVAFKIYDTYGVPRDVLEELAFQQNITVDWEGFGKALEEQKKRSRFSTETGMQKKTLYENIPLTATFFTGYGSLEEKGRIKAVYLDEKKGIFHLVADKSPFYPEKGGQAGDRGIIENDRISFRVSDTKIDENGLIYHAGKFEKGNPDCFKENEVNVWLRVDAEFRKKVSANHTTTHLLHHALRKILGKGVRQAGSYVADDRLRFDFVCFDDLTHSHIREAEKIVQEAILENRRVSVEELALEDALKSDAIALFSEKYEDRVRVIRIEGYHSEVCGGTHVENTSDIFLFKITGFSSIGKNLKRIEALTYREALTYLDNYRHAVLEISGRLETVPEKLPQRVEKLISETREKDKTVKQYEDTLASMISEKLVSQKDFVSAGGKVYNYVSSKVSLGNPEVISRIADMVTGSLENCISFIAYEEKEKILFVVKVGAGVKDEFPAVSLIKEISSVMGGGGGGNDVFARGSGKNKDRFGEAAERIKQLIQNKGTGK